MNREECIQKIRHIQKSMYTFEFEDRKLHKFKADDADKFYYYLDMIAKYLDEDVPKEKEPKTGHWIDTGSGQECSECREIQYGYDSFRYFCANCGAKMVEPQESEEEE